MIFALGMALGGKVEEKESRESSSKDGLHCWENNIKVAWYEIVELCGTVKQAKEGHMVGLLISVVSNVGRID